MFTRIITATALTLCLAAAPSFAQTSSTQGVNTLDSENTGSTPAASWPKSWTKEMGAMFFTDETGKTLRSQDEISKNWAMMSDEQKAMVKEDCASGNSNSAGTEGSRNTNMTQLCDYTKSMM